MSSKENKGRGVSLDRVIALSLKLDAWRDARDKDAQRYRLIRQDHHGELLPDLALYGGKALDDYIDDAWAKAQKVGAT